jgi:hypothetical protein
VIKAFGNGNPIQKLDFDRTSACAAPPMFCRRAVTEEALPAQLVSLENLDSIEKSRAILGF